MFGSVFCFLMIFSVGWLVGWLVFQIQFFANIISGIQSEGEGAMCLWPPVSATFGKFLGNFQVDPTNDSAMRQTIEALQRVIFSKTIGFFFFGSVFCRRPIL